MSNIITNPNNRLLRLAHSSYRLPASMRKSLEPILNKVYPLVMLFLTVVFVTLAQLGGGAIAGGIIVGLSIRAGAPPPSLEGSLEEVLARIGPLIWPNTALEFTIFLIGLFGPIFIILAIWLRLFEKRALWTIGLENRQVIWYYGRGLLVGLLMFTACVGILAAFGLVDFEADTSRPQGMLALGGVSLIFLGWMVQGAAEEALTRGWLLSVISIRYGLFWGVLLSSSLFAILHLFNPSVSLIAMLNLFLFGLFAALYALYEEGLWGVFSIHAVWNWAQGNIFGFEVSGNPQAGGALIDLMEVGPDYLTGGPFGPEGGLAVTAVLGVSCVVVWVLGMQKSNTTHG